MSEDCIAPWKELAGSCYKTNDDEQETDMTWTKARDVCRRHGGDLASVNSKGENEFLQSMVSIFRIATQSVEKEGVYANNRVVFREL